MKKKGLHLAVILLCCLPFVYLATIFSGLPENVPTHFNAEGVPEDYSPKSSLWFLTGFLASITIGLYFLLRNIHRLDPKRIGQGQSAGFNKLAIGLVLLLTTLNFFVLVSADGHFDALNKPFYVLLGVLFMFLGNFMHSIRPNYFAGIRLPWTLSDNDNWRLTHRLTGRVWVIGGAVIVVGSFFLPGNAMVALILVTICVLVVVPMLYSLMLFRRKQRLQQ